MKKTLILTSIISMLTFGAYAEEMPQPPMPDAGPNGNAPRMGMMAKLTDEQKSCIEAFGCKMPERPNMGEGMARPEPGQHPEMTEERKEAMDCIKKAMESCGIEMPQRPERPSDKMPPVPENAPEMPDMPAIPDVSTPQE